jgi:hypothetical protein
MVSAIINNDTQEAVSAVEAGLPAVDPALGAQPNGKATVVNGHDGKGALIKPR